MKRNTNQSNMKKVKTFKQKKYRPSRAHDFIKYNSIPREGDIYKECEDGWFKNQRTGGRTDILNIDNYEDFYEEL